MLIKLFDKKCSFSLVRAFKIVSQREHGIDVNSFPFRCKTWIDDESNLLEMATNWRLPS